MTRRRLHAPARCRTRPRLLRPQLRDARLALALRRARLLCAAAETVRETPHAFYALYVRQCACVRACVSARACVH
eukprot:2281951-Pleurochrysis_carterae.AAC.5